MFEATRIITVESKSFVSLSATKVPLNMYAWAET